MWHWVRLRIRVKDRVWVSARYGVRVVGGGVGVCGCLCEEEGALGEAEARDRHSVGGSPRRWSRQVHGGRRRAEEEQRAAFVYLCDKNVAKVAPH